MTISKSKYMTYKSCPKAYWLLLNKPELAVEDPKADKHIQDGKEVGELAKQYFDNTVDVTSFDEEGNLDINEMIGKTNMLLLEKDKIIAEASFSVDGLFCSVDLLVPNVDGYDIYEVKATTEVEKDHYIDVAYQKYVLEKRGLKINRVYLLHLNNQYHRHGELDLHGLFMAEDITDRDEFVEAYSYVDNDIQLMRNIANNKEEISIEFFSSCKDCPFHQYCFKDVPVPSVFDINGINKPYEKYNSGTKTYLDVLAANIKLNKRQQIQIESFMQDKETIIDKKALKAFLGDIEYPIYYLDFESMQNAIPLSDDAWPYEQIPTQYSLHIEYANGTIEHKEFLGDDIDPRRAIAEALCRDIPMDACVLAYFKGFECGRLNELAELYPDLRDHLSNISEHVIDLIVPFKSGMYYHKDMGGSNSIKYVLPALYPNDPELDYHALPVVHNGSEAMDIYPKMIVADPKEKQRIRDGLLQYCCLDTLAMVKVLHKLKESVK